MKTTVISLIRQVVVMHIFILKLMLAKIGAWWSQDGSKLRSVGTPTAWYQNLETQNHQVQQILYHAIGAIQHVGWVVSYQAGVHIPTHFQLAIFLVYLLKRSWFIESWKCYDFDRSTYYDRRCRFISWQPLCWRNSWIRPKHWFRSIFKSLF